MKLIKKIRDYIHDKKLALGLASILASVPVAAQADFFDGMPGPKNAQIHYTANFGNEVSYNLALKYFGGDLMAVIAGDVNAEGLQSGFAGVGYIANLEGIGILPLIGYSGNEDQGVAHVLVQGTVPIGDVVVIDGNYHAIIPAHGNENHALVHQFGLTPSVGNAEFRVGPEFAYEIGEDLSVKLLMRYDLDAVEHGEWVEIGLNPDGGAQLQFRGNFSF